MATETEICHGVNIASFQVFAILNLLSYDMPIYGIQSNTISNEIMLLYEVFHQTHALSIYVKKNWRNIEITLQDISSNTFLYFFF